MTSLYYSFQRNRAEFLFNKYIRKKRLKVAVEKKKSSINFIDNEDRSLAVARKSRTTPEMFLKLRHFYQNHYTSLENIRMLDVVKTATDVAVEVHVSDAKTVYFTYQKDMFCPSLASSKVIEHYVNCEKVYNRLLWLHDEARDRPRPDVKDYYSNELVKICDFNTFKQRRQD